MAFAGTAFLDIIVETDEPEGLLRVDTMRKVRELQEFFEALPHVRKTVSIVDYVSQLHGALDDLPETEIAARHLPATDDLLAETFIRLDSDEDDVDQRRMAKSIAFGAGYGPSDWPPAAAFRVPSLSVPAAAPKIVARVFSKMPVLAPVSVSVTVSVSPFELVTVTETVSATPGSVSRSASVTDRSRASPGIADAVIVTTPLTPPTMVPLSVTVAVPPVEVRASS